MKNKIIISSLISSAVLLNPSISFSKMNNFKLTPYGGVDVGMQHFGFKSGYGDNLFKKRLPKGNLFIGLKFNDYFGIEGGYETTIESKKETKIIAGEKLLGNLILGGPGEADYMKFSSRVKIAGLNIGITTNYPLYVKNNNSLSILGYIGIKHSKIKLKRSTISVKDYGTPEIAGGLPDLNLNKDNKKNIVKLSIGCEYLFSKHIGLRGIVGWENTAKLKPTFENKSAQLKNSISYSLGIVLR